VTKNLIDYKKDHRIRYEIGAENKAYSLSCKMDSSIKLVEIFFNSKFNKKVAVSVFQTTKSFSEHSGAHPQIRGMTNWSHVFISQLAFNENIEYSILIHELTHLHTFYKIGTFHMIGDLPSWYTEGIATYVSNGAGAEDCTDSLAIEFIKNNKCIKITDKGNLLFPSTCIANLPFDVFYRQSYLFTKYLIKYDSVAFDQLLVDIESGKKFKKYFIKRFSKSPKECFQNFKNNIIISSGNSKM
jgi:hypothetical protein